MNAVEFDCRFAYCSGFALDLTFESSARVTALAGPSGCGKTTALNLMAGLLTPREGRIVLGGLTVFDSRSGVSVPTEQRAVGYVFQDYQLFPHLTVEQNLRYGLHRASKPAVRLDRAVGVLKLSSHLKQYPAELSGGLKQRVALGRAILRAPKILLLDEPLAAIDAEHRRELQSFLVELLDELSIPAVLVSHDAENVQALAQRVVNVRNIAGPR